MSSTEQAEWVIVGKLGAVYGIKGWLRVHSYADEPADIFNYRSWQIGRDGARQPIEVSQWRWHNKGLVAKFAQIDDRDEAAQLTGMEIVVSSSEFPVLAENDFYWRDLIGLRVINQDGYDMGQVEHVFATPANDVLVVQANAKDAYGKQERLIPFIQSRHITEIDQETGVMTVDWPADF